MDAQCNLVVVRLPVFFDNIYHSIHQNFSLLLYYNYHLFLDVCPNLLNTILNPQVQGQYLPLFFRVSIGQPFFFGKKNLSLLIFLQYTLALF